MPKGRDTEEIKAGTDLEGIWEKIVGWSESGWESIPEGELNLTKWYGLFYHKPTPGYFMIRTRVIGGVLHAGNYRSEQLRELADITREYGRDIMDFTVRQQVELRWIRIEDFPATFARLRSVGLDSRQTGMDNIRGVAQTTAETACEAALREMVVGRVRQGDFHEEQRQGRGPKDRVVLSVRDAGQRDRAQRNQDGRLRVQGRHGERMTAADDVGPTKAATRSPPPALLARTRARGVATAPSWRSRSP